MSSIPSSLPASLSAGTLSYPARASRSLLSLSSSAQSAVPADDDTTTTAAADDASTPLAQIARQNRLAALADHAAATGATQSALAAMAGRPAAALAAQGNGSAAVAWSLLGD
jgi:hypothetical protein